MNWSACVKRAWRVVVIASCAGACDRGTEAPPPSAGATVTAPSSTAARLVGGWQRDEPAETVRANRLLQAAVREPPLVEAEIAALAMTPAEHAHYAQTVALIAGGGAVGERIRGEISRRIAPWAVIGPATLVLSDGAARTTQGYRIAGEDRDGLVLALAGSDGGAAQLARVRFVGADTIELAREGTAPVLLHRVTVVR